MKLFKKFSNQKYLKEGNVNKKIVFIGGLFFGIIPFLFIIYLLLGPVIRVIQKDINSIKMMIISENLNIRSDKEKDSYVTGSYPFGTEVNVYEVFDNNWAEVSIGDNKGYMSFEYLVLPETFYIIKGMFGNENAKNLISGTIYRNAISAYLQKNNFTTKIEKNEREKLYGKGDMKEAWQIYAEDANAQFNTFCYGDYNGDKKKDAAFILTNIKSAKRKLIVLNIDSDISEKYGELITFKDLEDENLFVKHIPKNSKMIINGNVQKTGIDGILIGTNRDKSLNDVFELMIFNGKNFEFYPQIINMEQSLKN
jgi:hypothetical protein